jgi:hypothetical protein
VTIYFSSDTRHPLIETAPHRTMKPYVRRSSSVVFALLIFIHPLSYAAAARQATALYTHSQQVRDPSSSDTNDNSCLTTTSTSDNNKEKSYNWPPQQDAMVLAHNAIRKELSDMTVVLEKLMDRRDDDDSDDGEVLSTIQSWEIDAIRSWWKGHEAHVRYHCKNENEHLHPAMSERLKGFPVHKMKQDHDEIQQFLDQLAELIVSSSSSSSSNTLNDSVPIDLTQLSELWGNYTERVVHHFQEEEEEGVVSTRQAFTAKEWAPIIKGFFDIGAKEEFGSLIHAMGGEEEFRTNFMRRRKIPGFVWRLAFKKNLRYYETTMVRHMEALISGVPPQ